MLPKKRVMLQLRLFQLAIIICLLSVLTACSSKPDYIIVFENARGCEKGDEVVYKDLVIGEVIEVSSINGNLAEIGILVKKPCQHYIQEKSVFIVRSTGETGSGKRFIEMTTPLISSPKLPIGSTIRGADDELERKILELRMNWKVNFAVVLTGLITLFIMWWLFKKILRAAIATGGIGAGIAVAAIYTKSFARLLDNYLPPDYHSGIISFVLLALLTYLATVGIIGFFFRSLRKAAP